MTHSTTNSPTPGAPVRPTFAFMRRHPAHWIALGFGSGLSPVAPGTAGTLFAWASWLLLSHWLGSTALGVVIAVATLVGWWACTVTARHLNTLDPSNIVWDEVVAFWLVLWLVLPAGWLTQLVAFGLFRLFDAVKKGPVGWADRTFHGFGPRGGFGILADDFVAAFLTLLVMASLNVVF